MKTANHTPGPWNYSGPTMSGRFSIYANGPLAYSAGVDDYGQEAEQNARLIAAAPELLASLEECLVFVDAHRRMALGEGSVAAMNARAAIAKAKGGE